MDTYGSRSVSVGAGQTLLDDRVELREPRHVGQSLVHRLPRDVRRRYRAELAAGQVVIVAAAGGQPADTLAALLARAGGRLVDQWWQEPADLFAPPELAGPF